MLLLILLFIMHFSICKSVVYKLQINSGLVQTQKSVLGCLYFMPLQNKNNKTIKAIDNKAQVQKPL